MDIPIHEKARKWRKEQVPGGRLEDAAKIIGISRSYLSELETGKKEFSTQAVKKFLAAAPGYFTPNDFYGGPH